MEIPQSALHSKSRVLIIILTCVFSLIIATVLWLQLEKQSQHRIPDFETAFATKYSATIRAFGQLKPTSSSSVISQVSGRVIEAYVKAGSFVKTGDNIISLQNRDLHEQVKRLSLDYRTARASFNSARAKNEQALLDAKNEILLAKGDLVLLKAELDAKQSLVKSNIISILEFERAKANVVRGELSVQAKVSALESLEKVGIATLENAELSMIRAQQALENAEYATEQLTLSADMDGVITQLHQNIEPGASIKQDQFIAQISNTANMYAQMSISAGEASSLSIGQSAVLTIKGQEVAARISRISPYVVENQVEFDIEIDANLPDTAIPNISVFADVITAEETELVALPKSEMFKSPHRRYNIYVFNQVLNQLELREIQVARITDNTVYVSEGLEEGEQILPQSPAMYDSIAVLRLSQLRT